MPDLEKVIKGLECCANEISCIEKCPYNELGDTWHDCVPHLADDALTLLTAQEPKWISVKDRMPENADHPGSFCPRYQVMTKYGMTEGWYNPDKGCWYTLCWFLIGRYDEDDIDMERGDIPRITDKLDVTHWMPLPEPPKEES